MTGLLDKLKPLVRHAIIALTPVVAAFLLHLIPSLQAQYGANALVSVALTLAVLYLTPLTQQYGRGARKAAKK